MGLFSRQDNSSNNDDLDLELPTREDFQQPLVDEPGPRTPTQPSQAAPSGRYGIDNAIELLRQLPESEDRQTMSVVCKTLESAQIRMSDLLQDAQQKEQKLKQQHKSLEQEIEQLQSKMDDRRKQLKQLAESLEEVTRIKARFEQGLDKPKAASQPAQGSTGASGAGANKPPEAPRPTTNATPQPAAPTNEPQGPGAAAGRRTRGGPTPNS